MSIKTTLKLTALSALTLSLIHIFSKGNINLNHQGKNLIQFVNARLNQQPLGYIETYVDFSKPVKTVNAYLQPDCQNFLAAFKFSHKELQSAVNFSGKNFPMAQLIALLNFPNTLTGNADFNIQLALTNSELTKGEFYFDAQNGEILGLNLLDMAAQYLPINYNSEDVYKRQGHHSATFNG